MKVRILDLVFFILAIVVYTSIFTGCGRHDVVHVSSDSPVQVSPATSLVETLIDAENSFRLGQGQAVLSKGLSCSVQQVSSGQWLSNASPGYNGGQGVLVLTGTSYTFLNTLGFNQPNTTGVNNVLPSAIRGMFNGINYKIACSGHMVAERDEYYTFTLASDDGSILTVDGTQVINNDGNHGVTTKTGVKYLRQGVRSFSLLYAQSGGGSLALTLDVNNSNITFLH